ncbi:hypothetical protein B4Q04_20200 [Zobellia sp. OII3]|nr:hypothetical protein B4Q04_20200 [Zobellia sp. OII3]
MFFLKLIVIFCCTAITFQDFKERTVLWFLFPILGIVLAIIHLQNNPIEQFLLFILTNILLVSGVLLILILYTRYIMRKKFLNVSFGLGDVLFFYALALGFPTMTFVFIFVGAILFSLILFLIFKKTWALKTVPLAGLMGLYLSGVFIINFFPTTPSLYLL